MADGWVRATATDPNNNGFFGFVPLIGLTPGQTVLRSWWNVGFHHLVDDVATYPPGSSILRAGVAYDVAGLDETNTPTPITNADADWIAITTLNPSTAVLARATTNAWLTVWGFPVDLSIKSQRKNDTLANRTLYVSWEMSLNDEIPGFTMNGWQCSMDCYIRTP